MAKKILYIPAEENEQVVKYSPDFAAYEIEEKHVLETLTEDGGHPDVIIKALKNMELSPSEAAKIILAVIGKVIDETEYSHETMMLKAAKAYCNSIKDYYVNRY